MSDSIQEIMKLEERLKEAELGPNPEFFEEFLSDGALMDGQRLKSKIVEAHHPGKGQKFDKVEMSDFIFVNHGDAVVVTCKGFYEGPKWSGTLKFMRVWLKKDGRWQIIAASTLT